MFLNVIGRYCVVNAFEFEFVKLRSKSVDDCKAVRCLATPWVFGIGNHSCDQVDRKTLSCHVIKLTANLGMLIGWSQHHILVFGF